MNYCFPDAEGKFFGCWLAKVSALHVLLMRCRKAITTLGAIRSNHLSLTCTACCHNALVAVAGLLEKLPPDTTVQRVRLQARVQDIRRWLLHSAISKATLRRGSRS